jgi:hypothetical protein
MELPAGRTHRLVETPVPELRQRSSNIQDMDMNIPFLTDDFSGLFDSFSLDSLLPGGLPGSSSFAFSSDQFDILDDMPEFGDGFPGGDFSDTDDILNKVLGPLKQLLESVLPFGDSTLNFDEFDIQQDSLPTSSYGVSNLFSYPTSSVPGSCAVNPSIPPDSVAPVSSTPPVSQPISFPPAEDSPGGNPFDPNPQIGPLTPEQSRAMAVKVGRQLMIDFPGMTKEQAAGIVGNLYHESQGMNANINELGSDPSSPTHGMPNSTAFGYGWGQWTGSRKQDYIKFCEQKGLDPRSPAANYAFLKHELQHGEADGTPSSLSKILSTGTVEDAAFAFRKFYERAAMPVDSERIREAREIYSGLG